MRNQANIEKLIENQFTLPAAELIRIRDGLVLEARDASQKANAFRSNRRLAAYGATRFELCQLNNASALADRNSQYVAAINARLGKIREAA